jgi:MFS family permease
MKALNPVQVTKEADVSKEIRVAMSKLAGVCCAIVIVDRIGRRKLLLFGSGVMMLCHLIFAGCFWSLSLKSTSEDVHSTPTKWNEHLRQTAVTTMYIFIFAWNIR